MKKTLVVPVDFSASSVNAVNYAADFAKASGASIALLHICDVPVISQEPVPAEVIDELLEEAKKKMEELKQNLHHKTGNELTISAEVRVGPVYSQIQDYCATAQQPIVIMGAHMTTATERMIFGSNVLRAMQNLSWPLIVVPNGIRFTGIGVAGLACDLRDVPATVHAESLIKWLGNFHPQLHILHITPKKHGMLDADEIKGAGILKEALKTFNPVFHYMQDENTEEAIAAFAEKNNLNLLVIIPKKHGLLNQLLHKSHSKQMIINTHIPIMAIHQ